MVKVYLVGVSLAGQVKWVISSNFFVLIIESWLINRSNVVASIYKPVLIISVYSVWVFAVRGVKDSIQRGKLTVNDQEPRMIIIVRSAGCNVNLNRNCGCIYIINSSRICTALIITKADPEGAHPHRVVKIGRGVRGAIRPIIARHKRSGSQACRKEKGKGQGHRLAGAVDERSVPEGNFLSEVHVFVRPAADRDALADLLHMLVRSGSVVFLNE